LTSDVVRRVAQVVVSSDDLLALVLTMKASNPILDRTKLRIQIKKLISYLENLHKKGWNLRRWIAIRCG